MPTYTPTPELLAIPEPDRIRWAEALESGEYEQGTEGHLIDVCGRYCCLGVWDQINGFQYGSVQEWGNIPQNPISMKLGFLPISEIPNFPIDADKRLPYVATDGGIPVALHTLNDSRGMTFPQIAQLLRGNEVGV